MLSDCFTGLLKHTKYSIMEKEIVHHTQKSLTSFASVPTRLSLVQSLKSAYGMKLSDQSLKGFYFQRLAMAVQNRKTRQENEFRAQAFHNYKLYLKHFYAILNYTTTRLEKQEANDKAI
jgi:hypothetical protein